MDQDKAPLHSASHDAAVPSKADRWRASSHAAGDYIYAGVQSQVHGQSAALQASPGGEGGADAYIPQAHERSRAHGLGSSDVPDFASPNTALLRSELEENHFLFQHAAPVMETLYGQIANTHSMVLLTSASGMILHSLGDNDFLEKAQRVALTPGMDWSERGKGTNAVGTALTEGEALTVHGDQHYLEANRFLTCSCAPIYDPYGQVVGALDVSGDRRGYHQHTLALVRMSAQMIENHMFAGVFPRAIRLHFHARPEFLGTLVEGIAAFSPDGRFLSANRSAQFQLGLPFAALKAHTFSSLFGLPVSALLEQFWGTISSPKQFCMYNGVSVWCRAQVEREASWAAPRQPEAHSQQGTVAPLSPARKPRFSSLQYLDTGDPQLSAVIRKLRMLSGRDIPIMILGETGTGKDLLAQAIHSDSARSSGPFVSVNCASIPDTLIEAELFGYEEGAFTGARKKGSAGKIQQASGGTLFLDEIGDMPKHLQARLLRVLQERKISPLGSGREIEVDLAVISATHKNPKGMIAEGDFREDLYYRLNGLVVKLPALRERTDFEFVMRRLLDALSEGGERPGIADEVLGMFKSYHWPGNFRQLHNLLRTAVVMVGREGCIERQHLPDDFLEEVESPSSDVPTRAHLIPARLPDSPQTAKEAVHPHRSMEGQRLQDIALQTMAQALREHKGNVSAVAKALGISRNTIYRKKDLLPPGLLD
ncbi:sigma-54-dependent Fis family transcriptional regulator [Ottowia thiooxydans]|uniref:sigma-54-dependent Fis family transcriptional regulator n=1 Tax=Ottowia thiooxydans TaxID=219182 RepID=UPI00040E0C59|nr:sigma-54-dependent Fis family transcriptional regulator [Ottowia thiooxydans]